MEREPITLTNNYHHTSINLIVKDGILSSSQIKRSKRKLCGIKGCVCSNNSGIRGITQYNQRVNLDYDSDNNIIAYII